MTVAFVPASSTSKSFGRSVAVTPGAFESTRVSGRYNVPRYQHHQHQLQFNRVRSSLLMAAEDFNESKYTEAAWSSIAALTNVAESYQATTVEAPFLLDVMLNPKKHNAGENAESAQKVVDKALSKAGVNVKDLRSELDFFLSKQARVSNSSQKTMGRTLQKVLETARVGQSILGVSTLIVRLRNRLIKCEQE